MHALFGGYGSHTVLLAAMASPSSDVVLHVPDAHNPRIDLDLDEFMGTWCV